MASSLTGRSAQPSNTFVLELNSLGRSTRRESYDTYTQQVDGVNVTYQRGRGSFFVPLPEGIPSKLACTVTLVQALIRKPSHIAANLKDHCIRSNIQAQGASTLTADGNQSAPYSILVPCIDPDGQASDNRFLSNMATPHQFYCPCGLPEMIEFFPSRIDAQYRFNTTIGGVLQWNGFKEDFFTISDAPYDLVTNDNTNHSATLPDSQIFVLLKIEME